jgi:hypothetical protein
MLALFPTGKKVLLIKEMDITYEQLSESLQMANAKGGIYDSRGTKPN